MKAERTLYADLDEMVFEGREKAYGAYFLRKAYGHHLGLGLLLVSFAFLIVTAGPRVASMILPQEEAVAKNKVHIVKVSMSELPPPPALDEQSPPPPPPPKAPPPQVKTVAFKIPEPTPQDELNEEETEQTIADVEELKEAPNIGIEDKEGDDEAAFFDGVLVEEEPEPEVIVEVVDEPDVNTFIFVEEEPSPINLSDIQKAIGYPDIAKDAGIKGVVLMRILVDENGRYTKHVVLNSVHPILTQACEKEIPNLRFTPAIQGNKPIKFWINVPFVFKLIE